MKRLLLPLVSFALAGTLTHAFAEVPANKDASLKKASGYDNVKAVEVETHPPVAAHPSDLENLGWQMNVLQDRPALTTDLSLYTDSDESEVVNEPNLAALYTQAMQARQTARRDHLRQVSRWENDAQEAYLLTIDKSLFEREEERVEAESASPEASPATAPFSLSRPEDIVSADSGVSVFEALTTSPDLINASVATPEPSAWALFGLGAAYLVFGVPARSGKIPASRRGKL